MTDPGFESRPDVPRTVDEIARLARHFDSDVLLLKPDASLWPALSTYHPNVFYRIGRNVNRTICQEAPSAIDTNAYWVRDKLSEAVAAKTRKAMKYDAVSKPLWLLVGVEGYVFADAFATLARAAMSNLDVAPFSRAIVWLVGSEPAVFE
jgi:hypothetical protein